MTTQHFRRIIRSYFAKHGRDLPWRTPHLAETDGVLDPYAILVSEVMLQQTQVERVVPKFEAWLAAWPDFAALAQASLPDVLTQWQDLGYNRRAVALQRCAQVVVERSDGQLPREADHLVALPGIGPYTAAAIQAFAFNKPVVMIETNIRSVFLHHYCAGRAKVADQELLPLIALTLDRRHPREWYWALMDYGSYLKRTVGNASRRSRQYVRQSAFQGSRRQVRGLVLKLLTGEESATERAVRHFVEEAGADVSHLEIVLVQLEREGFIVRKSKQMRLATTVVKK